MFSRLYIFEQKRNFRCEHIYVLSARSVDATVSAGVLMQFNFLAILALCCAPLYCLRSRRRNHSPFINSSVCHEIVLHTLLDEYYANWRLRISMMLGARCLVVASQASTVTLATTRAEWKLTFLIESKCWVLISFGRRCTNSTRLNSPPFECGTKKDFFSFKK